MKNIIKSSATSWQSNKVETDMSNNQVCDLPSLDFEVGMLVEQRGEAVICSLTAGIASIIGAIFFAEPSVN
jgi:hypothetical protein